MTFQEKQSALATVRNLIEACGPQTLAEILRELRIQAGCTTAQDAEIFAAFALREFERFRVLETDEVLGEPTCYGFTYSS